MGDLRWRGAAERQANGGELQEAGEAEALAGGPRRGHRWARLLREGSQRAPERGARPRSLSVMVDQVTDRTLRFLTGQIRTSPECACLGSSPVSLPPPWEGLGSTRSRPAGPA